MSSYYESQASVSVHLSANGIPLIITLLDGSFDIVASSIEVLETDVRPGIYILRISFGRNEHEEFIQIGSDGYSATNLDSKLKLKTSIPEAGSPVGNFVDTHLREMPLLKPRQGRIVLIINTMDTEKPTDIDSNLPLWTCELLNDDYEDIKIKPADWRHDSADKAKAKAAIWSLNVDAGGHVLRWFLRQPKNRKTMHKNYKFLDQSLWVEAGWTTFVFLGFDPVKKRIRKSHTAIYFLKTFIGYNFDAQLSKKMAAATELVLTGLKKGTFQLGRADLNVLLYEKFSNPMLGILACHVLLYRKQPNWDLFDEVLNNMSGLMPKNPDILALRILKSIRLKQDYDFDSELIAWPPMLYASYTALLKQDWNTEGEIISPDSQAAISIPYLLQQGPWTMWMTPTNFETETIDSYNEELIEMMSEEAFTKAQHISTTRGSIQMKAGTKQAYTKGVSYADKEVERIVSQYLQQSVKSHSYLSSLETVEQEGLVQMSRKLGLPVSSVDKALQSITKKKSL